MPHHYTLPIVSELRALPESQIAVASMSARAELTQQPLAPAPVKPTLPEEAQPRRSE
jgi:hypothetical protein